MKTKRGELRSKDDDEARHELKVQKISEDKNAVLPLASYDDEEDDETKVLGKTGISEPEAAVTGDDDETSDDEFDGQQTQRGMIKRQVETRRDCPYLDTVNRQVHHSPDLVFIILLHTDNNIAVPSLVNVLNTQCVIGVHADGYCLF